MPSVSLIPRKRAASQCPSDLGSKTRMHPRQLPLFLLLAGLLPAQQPAAPPAETPAHVFQVIEQITLPQKDGGSVTFKRVEPPASPFPAAPLPAPVLTSAELARQQELDAKSSVVISVSASVYPQGLALLRWSCNGAPALQAVSNVDFRWLAGLDHVETADTWYSLVMGAGAAADALPPEAASAAQYLPANGTPSFILFQPQGQVQVNFEDAQALQARVALQALMDHFAAHRAELIAQFAQRQAEAAAQALAARNAPPPAPQHSVTHFWPLQPAQRAAIEAKTQAQTQTQEGGAQP